MTRASGAAARTGECERLARRVGERERLARRVSEQIVSGAGERTNRDSAGERMNRERRGQADS